MQFTLMTANVPVAAVVAVAAVVVVVAAAVEAVATVVASLSFFHYKKPKDNSVSPNFAWPTMNESSSSSFPENLIEKLLNCRIVKM